MNQFHAKCLLALKLILLVAVFTLPQTGLALGSGQETAEPVTPENEDREIVNNSTETDINEDNYRRFMELKNQPGERNSLPASAYVKPLVLEKMQSLPEDSQKHLRNMLRDIIVQGEAWTPDQLGKDFPFTPSEKAESNPGLRQKESEAWDELVSEYHGRESEIYEHADRSQAATATGTPANRL